MPLLGVLKTEVRGPKGSKLAATLKPESDDGQYRLSFYPEDEGEHFLYLYYNDYPVPGSPHSAYASAQISSREFDPSKVFLRGEGLKEAKANREAEFIIDGSEAGPGKPNCTMMGSRADIPVSLTHMGNNVWKANYTPILQGKYELHVMWGDRPVHGSPYKVQVVVYSDASKVLVQDEQVKQGVVGKEMKSLIDTRKAGPGKLTAQCMGPTKAAYCELYDHRDGTFTLNVKPEETGKHSLSIKYGEEHVAGSPYTLYISSPPDAQKVKVHGPGVEHGILSRFKSNFIVETKGAGAGQLTVRVRGPKGAFNVEMQREKKNDRTIHCRYDPKEPGDYQIEVRWAGEHVPGSPFGVMIFDTQSELDRFLAGQPISSGPPLSFLPPGWVGPPPPGFMMPGPPMPQGSPQGFPPRGGFPYSNSTIHSNASSKPFLAQDY